MPGPNRSIRERISYTRSPKASSCEAIPSRPMSGGMRDLQRGGKRQGRISPLREPRWHAVTPAKYDGAQQSRRHRRLRGTRTDERHGDSGPDGHPRCGLRGRNSCSSCASRWPCVAFAWNRDPDGCRASRPWRVTRPLGYGPQLEPNRAMRATALPRAFLSRAGRDPRGLARWIYLVRLARALQDGKLCLSTPGGTDGAGSFILANGRWLGGAFLLCLCSSFGQTFFISLSGGDIRRELGLSHGDFGLLYMLATLASAVTLPFLGRAIDRFSTRYVAAARSWAWRPPVSSWRPCHPFRCSSSPCISCVSAGRE